MTFLARPLESVALVRCFFASSRSHVGVFQAGRCGGGGILMQLACRCHLFIRSFGQMLAHVGARSLSLASQGGQRDGSKSREIPRLACLSARHTRSITKAFPAQSTEPCRLARVRGCDAFHRLSRFILLGYESLDLCHIAQDALVSVLASATATCSIDKNAET